MAQALPTNWRDTQLEGPIAVPTSPADIVTGSGIYLEAVYFVGGGSDSVVTVSDKAGSPKSLYKDTISANSSQGGPVGGPWPAEGGISWVASASGVTGFIKYKRTT